MKAAMDHLHGLGVALMDVKPANIGITESGTFVLIDVGNAAVFGNATEVAELFRSFGLPSYPRTSDFTF